MTRQGKKRSQEQKEGKNNPVTETDLARDNLSNDIPAADLNDI